MPLRTLGVLAVALLVLSAPSAFATDYYADVSGGPWTSNTTWHLVSNSGPSAPAGAYPGSAPGDRAIIDFQGISVTVSTSIPNALTLDANNVSCFVTVTTGGTLPLTGSSQVAGGTILSLTGGTVNNGGTLTIGSTSSINWSTGTITGSGTTTISAGADLNATGSSMVVTGGQIINVFDTLTYGASASGLAVNSGATIAVQSGGLFDVQNISGIATDGLGGANITVNSGGTFLKSNGNFGTNINPIFNNNGTVQVNISSLGFARGTHTGAFVMNGPTTGVGFTFGGPHTFSGATGSISGTGSAFFGGTTVISSGADLDITNFSNDSFSSFSGNGTINLSGTFTWNGSSISGITFNALGGSTVNISGAGNTSLASAAHLNNSGTTTINPGATFSIVSDARITNNGTINIAGDLTINSDGAPLSRIDNLATRSISKTAGAGSAFLSVPVNNAGSISSLQGVLKLQKGGLHSGSWGLGTGAALAFDGGTHQFTAGFFSTGAGTVSLTSGTMDLDAAFTLPPTISFQQSGGVLTGSGNFTVAGSFLWTGGTMDNSSGAGQTVLNSASAQIAGTTSTIVLSGRILSNTGAFTYNPTPGIELSIDNGALFLNTGTFTLVGDAEIDSNSVSTPGFTNGTGGVINKSTGTGIADIYAYFRNNQSVNITSGSIALHGGGQELSTVNFGGAANKIIIANGTFSLATPPGLNGGGAVSVDGPFATLALTGAITIPRLEILNGATVAGGTLNIGTSLLWQAGRMTAGITNITNTATLDATSLTGTITLDSHSLTNLGVINWDGTTHALQLINGSSLTNSSLFDAIGSGFIGGTSPANTITNNGTFRKSGGASGTRIDPLFTNNSVVNSQVSGQSLIFAGGGSQPGGSPTMSAVAGAMIDFLGGTFTVAPGTAPFGGSGIFRVNGGTLAITGSMSIPSPATLTVQSGALSVATASTFQIFAGLTWTGGTLQGDGTTRTFGGSIGNTAAKTLNNNHTLTIAAGTVPYTASSPNQVTIGGTAALNIESSATLAMANGTTIAGTSTDGLTITGGTLDVSAGTAILGRGSMTSGFIATGASGILNLSNGTFTINGGTVSGTGTILTSGSQTLTVNSALTIPNLLITNGTLNGTGALTINGGSWTGGTMSGTGTTTIAAPATFGISGGTPLTLARNLTNLGTVNAGPTNTLNFSGGAVLTNSGTWNDSNRQLVCVACTGRFHNASGATYTKTGGLGTLQQNVQFDNDGTVTVVAPTGVAFNGGGAHTGDFTAGGEIWFNGSHTFTSTSDTTGAGSLVFRGTATHQGTIGLSGGASTITIQNTANVAFNTAGAVTSPRFAIAGNISGTGALSLTGIGSSWTGGTISGTGGFSIGSGADLSINNSSGTPMLDGGRTLTNSGTIGITGSLAAGPGGGSVVNLSGFRAQPAGSITFGPAFTNQAVVQFLGGTTTFNGGYTQTAGSTLIAGGNFGSPLPINIDAGTVSGNGTITGNVINDGTFNPGASAGTITVAGNFTQSNTGVLNSEIGGTAPGTGYDQLVVTGNAALDGTMNVTLINAFTPADNNTFDLVTWASRTGAFAMVNLPPFPAGSLNVTYEPNAFRISADAIGDLGITKTGPASAPVGQNVSYTIAVSNAGPSPTDSVVVSDPTPANMTFVGTSGDCTTAFPCSLGTVAAGATKTIVATYTITGGAGSNVTNIATVTTTSTDTNTTNNSSSASTFVELTDVSVTKTGPTATAAGQNVSFTITVNNAGPSPAAAVTVNDPTPANLAFVSNSGDCTTAFPCALGTLASGATKTITATYAVTGGAGGNISNTASVTTSTSESTTTNNSSTATVFVDLSDLAISKTGPGTAQAGDDISFTITVANGGQSEAANVVVEDPTPGGVTFVSTSGDCNTAFPCSMGTVPSGATKTIIATYKVSAIATGASITNTATVTTTTADGPSNNTASATVAIDCLNTVPTDLTPAGTGAASGTLSWDGTGDSYVVYFGPAGSGCKTQFATTTGRSVPYTNLAPGTYEWRVESHARQCQTLVSACRTFTVSSTCTVPEAPIVSVVGQTTSAKTYEVLWEAVPGAVRYEIEEATNQDFVGAIRQTVTGTSQAYKHDVTVAAAFYYRVRAFAECTSAPGAYSTPVRVVIIPLPPKEQRNPQVNVPAGSEEVVVQQIFIPGQPGQNLFFTATTDRPWLTVKPEMGALTPAGVNLDVVADPKNLPNGTFTASVIVTITDGAGGRVSSTGTSVVTTPFSINLVTPVTPVAAKATTSQYALVIPTAGHLDGLNSHWQSDIRVTNAGFKPARYQLTFTPSGGAAQGVKQTSITVDAGATTALDDIVRNWFGLGTLNDGSNGMLEILPLDDPATTSLSTVASSRTYNVTGNGTLGQYIPAVPFPSFIGRALPNALPQILSLQQIAQSNAYRTNVGLAEAGGAPVNAVLSIFSAGGTKLTDVPVSLATGQQLQMNQLLKTQGLELTDGRVEVKVTGGEGKITAYASVVDNATQDPLLVIGTALSGTGSSKFVLPGVANLDNSLAHWRTDMRVFNYGKVSQPATLTFYPFNNGPSKSSNVLLGAGQIMTLDNVLKSHFDIENAGGVVHLTTPQPASLVVTGRTYNQTSQGTFGQFVPAVTVDQAVGANERTLHILQVEDSTRYRTNVGLAEVTGKPVTVEMQVVLPDSKITPTIRIPLAANEFRQFNVIRELGAGNVYNGRISIRVIDGQGRVTAYGSVIDEVTQDPTYVPAQ